MKIIYNRAIKILLLSLLVFSLSSTPTYALVEGSITNFNVESSHDLNSRSQLSAILQRITNRINFYVESNWWHGLTNSRRSDLLNSMSILSNEFENRIYPLLTSEFGLDPIHPVDRSGRTSVLFHRMKANIGGYVNTGDFFTVFQAPRSNQKNLIYINSNFIDSAFIKGFLAHEFMHVITMAQKEKNHNIQEEIWLNEARAEYASTFLNYDSKAANNILRRKNAFINNSHFSLTEWLNRSGDYGIVNVFTQYLVDHYGVDILSDSLKSNKTGIESINFALKKNGFVENFSDIFTDWTIAVLVNDCSLGSKYCFKNNNLIDLRIVPSTTFLPTEHGSSLSSRSATKNWAGNWHRFVGGKGNLRLDFSLEDNQNYRMPYLLCVTESNCSVYFAEIKNDGRSVIEIEDFGDKYFSLTIMPSVQHKMSGFNGSEANIFYNWTIVTEFVENIPDPTLQELLNTIQTLTQEVERLRGLLLARRNNQSCSLTVNLFVGVSNPDQVRCLQQILRDQGPGVYPEGLVTGRFLSLTRMAVIRFQEKYASEVLTPLGLTSGTGFVGQKTREKMNQLSR
ncbi:MAG: peptidoglycan-binding protein [Candidatus Nealsonbacteria bacterium]|nr:peptidoglycan-binding protein [Candidatus Nealsonbacteria bacterium]